MPDVQGQPPPSLQRRAGSCLPPVVSPGLLSRLPRRPARRLPPAPVSGPGPAAAAAAAAGRLDRLQPLLPLGHALAALTLLLGDLLGRQRQPVDARRRLGLAEEVVEQLGRRLLLLPLLCGPGRGGGGSDGQTSTHAGRAENRGECGVGDGSDANYLTVSERMGVKRRLQKKSCTKPRDGHALGRISKRYARCGHDIPKRRLNRIFYVECCGMSEP